MPTFRQFSAAKWLKKIDLVDTASPTPTDAVVLGVISSVSDVTALVARVHEAAASFRAAGVRKVWIYRAFDDGQEVMILEEIDDETHLRRWIDKPDAAAEWMSRARLGISADVCRKGCSPDDH